MNSVLKFINQIQTNILYWGNPFDCIGQDVIICITGNPGVTDFYIEFASEIHKSTGFPVCVIGHAGHEEVSDKKSNTLKNQEHLFNLQGQLNHKLDFINKCIDKTNKLHLIGHSIGAWFIVELLNRNDDLITRVSSVNLLFPTIQRMAESENGFFLNNIIRRIHLLAIFLFTFFSLLPESIKQNLVSIYLKVKALPSHYNERILKYLNPKVNEKVLFLAYDEMDNVVKLNCEAIDKIKHVTNVIYGSKDGWAPISYMEDLRVFQPALKMREVDVEHGFVLKSSEYIAGLVSDFITKT